MNSTIPSIFSSQPCILGEGLVWHPKRESLFWLDIATCTIYEKKETSIENFYDNSWQLNEICSTIVIDGESSDSICLVTDKSFGRLHLSTGEYKPFINMSLGEKMRANDGAVLPSGQFVFGSMEKSPSGENGELFALYPNGVLKKLLSGVGIPNTFCFFKNEKKLFVSDSFVQKMYSFSVEDDGNIKSESKKEVIDLSNTEATPDGGTIDRLDRLWNAHWDGGKVAVYSSCGELLECINLPVPKVTNCCFGGRKLNKLYITTAKEGMREKELSLYPLSGSTFVIECDEIGTQSVPFYMEI